MYYKALRQLLFQLSPEAAHTFTLKSLKTLEKCRLLRPALGRPIEYPIELMGLTLKNPIGLAAGLDKNGDYIDPLSRLGFGFLEIGTITPKKQRGNPKPRLYRLPQINALINRMGFNNKGVEHLVTQAKKAKYEGILGVNIGKNKTTDLNNAVNDYLHCLQKTYEIANYIVINVSSPNTPDLRKLQTEEYLPHLLTTLKQEQNKLSKTHKKYVPLVIKIAPELREPDIETLAKLIKKTSIDGIISTNTTVDKTQIPDIPHAKEQGGISGKPLMLKSTKVLKSLVEELPSKYPIIASGGVMSPEDAVKKIQAGAQAVQLYTGLIYEGPGLVKKCAQAVKKELEQTKNN